MALVLRKAVLPKNVSLFKCIKSRNLATTANKKNPAVLTTWELKRNNIREHSINRVSGASPLRLHTKPQEVAEAAPSTRKQFPRSYSCPNLYKKERVASDIPRTKSAVQFDELEKNCRSFSNQNDTYFCFHTPSQASSSSPSPPAQYFSNNIPQLVHKLNDCTNDTTFDAIRGMAACGVCPALQPHPQKPPNNAGSTRSFAACSCKCGCPCPFPCGPYGCGGCNCLPPPCNVPPRCIQYMTGYYYYPYGFWFCGPYHVTGTCVPGGPCSPGPCGPCGPAPPNPGSPCGPCNCGCACLMPDLSNMLKDIPIPPICPPMASGPPPDSRMASILNEVPYVPPASASYVVPQPDIRLTSLLGETPLTAASLVVSPTDIMKDSPTPVLDNTSPTKNEKLQINRICTVLANAVATSNKIDPSHKSPAAQSPFHLSSTTEAPNVASSKSYSTNPLGHEAAQSTSNSSRPVQNVTRRHKNLAKNSSIIAVLSVIDGFDSFCGQNRSNQDHQKKNFDNQMKKLESAAASLACGPCGPPCCGCPSVCVKWPGGCAPPGMPGGCCGCGCGCGPCPCGPCGPCGCGCGPCGPCPAPCGAGNLSPCCSPLCGCAGNCAGFFCGCGPSGCGCFPLDPCCGGCGCGCGCGPCGPCGPGCGPCGPCGPGCGPCCGPCGPCGCGCPPCGGACGCFCGPCCNCCCPPQPVCLPQTIAPGGPCGPVPVGPCACVFEGDSNSKCVKDPNNPDSVCFCYKCQSRRPDIDPMFCMPCSDNLTPRPLPPPPNTRVVINPNLAQNYPFNKTHKRMRHLGHQRCFYSTDQRQFSTRQPVSQVKSEMAPRQRAYDWCMPESVSAPSPIRSPIEDAMKGMEDRGQSLCDSLASAQLQKLHHCLCAGLTLRRVGFQMKITRNKPRDGQKSSQ